MVYRGSVLRLVLVAILLPHTELLNINTDYFYFAMPFKISGEHLWGRCFQFFTFYLFFLGRITVSKNLCELHSISSSVLDVKLAFLNFCIDKIMLICILSWVTRKDSGTVVVKMSPRALVGNIQAERCIFVFYLFHRYFTLS